MTAVPALANSSNLPLHAHPEPPAAIVNFGGSSIKLDYRVIPTQRRCAGFWFGWNQVLLGSRAPCMTACLNRMMLLPGPPSRVIAAEIDRSKLRSLRGEAE